MSATDWSKAARVFAVSAGALLLVAPLVYQSLVGAAGVVANLLPAAVPSSAIAVGLGRLLAIVVALYTASLAVDVQFRGFDVFRGEGRRHAVRLGAVWLVVGAVAVVLLDLTVSLYVSELAREATPVALFLPVLLLLALAFAALKIVSAFRTGLDESSRLIR
ncbi:hypothetical protein [Haloarchaeobius sp. DFWS5]|uniref:hypothetical protein n=1 Tax=Haloarchaeobius sp. DFWS5 TaxID=3446114 RepID=UPI003EBDE03D